MSLGAGRGAVRFVNATGEGIALDRVEGGRWRFASRAGGERIRLREGGPTRTLKNLLQEHAVPAWHRARLPLLFEGDRLVWVPGIGIAADFHARGPGLLPHWDGSCQTRSVATRSTGTGSTDRFGGRALVRRRGGVLK